MNLDYLLDNGPELVAIALVVGGLAYFLLLKRREWLADGVLTLDEMLDSVGDIGEEVKEAVANVRKSMAAIEEAEAIKAAEEAAADEAESAAEAAVIEEVVAQEEE
jgi:hypothetical protein